MRKLRTDPSQTKRIELIGSFNYPRAHAEQQSRVWARLLAHHGMACVGMIGMSRSWCASAHAPGPLPMTACGSTDAAKPNARLRANRPRPRVAFVFVASRLRAMRRREALWAGSPDRPGRMLIFDALGASCVGQGAGERRMYVFAYVFCAWPARPPVFPNRPGIAGIAFSPQNLATLTFPSQAEGRHVEIQLVANH